MPARHRAKASRALQPTTKSLSLSYGARRPDLACCNVSGINRRMDPDHIPDIGARHIAAVLAVAENRSFVAAAAALRISQPALSRSIKRVEDIIGVQLFERSTRAVALTEAGREFIAVAKRIASDLRITVENMRDLAEQKRGLVTISSLVSLANGVLPQAIAAYRRQQPGIEIQVRDGILESVSEDVKAGVAEFGVNYLVESPANPGNAAHRSWIFRFSRRQESHLRPVASQEHPFRRVE